MTMIIYDLILRFGNSYYWLWLRRQLIYYILFRY